MPQRPRKPVSRLGRLPQLRLGDRRLDCWSHLLQGGRLKGCEEKQLGYLVVDLPKEVRQQQTRALECVVHHERTLSTFRAPASVEWVQRRRVLTGLSFLNV